jgi:hypothetical protein
MKKKTDQTVKNFIEAAHCNIIEDRATTKVLLMDLMKWMQHADERQKEVGLIAAKYLETLQRSNEQLVKLAAIKQKNTSSNSEMTEREKQDLFDLINIPQENE